MQAQISVIPAAQVVRNNPQPAKSLPWWVIVVPIIAAVIITVVAVLLWVVSLPPSLSLSLPLLPPPLSYGFGFGPLSLILLTFLSQFGFFRRRKHEQIKQKCEELQTLNNH